MPIIQSQEHNFQVNTGRYHFSFTAKTLHGDFKYKQGKSNPGYFFIYS